MNIATQDVGLTISAAGTTQGTATLLINGANGISTAAASSGVILFPGGVGTSQLVYNGGANPVKVYPPVGAQINGIPVNGAHTLATNTACVYWTFSSTQIVGVLSA